MLKKKSSVAKRQRRKLSAEFKAKVALAALREDKALAQLCAEFEVHSTQITEGKRLLVERAAMAFAGGAGAQLQSPIDVVPLHAKIGELTLENDFLERALTKAGLLSARR
jgi:transposase